MPITLLILHTHPITPEETLTMNHLKKNPTINLQQIDLTNPKTDYKKITKTILKADQVQAW